MYYIILAFHKANLLIIQLYKDIFLTFDLLLGPTRPHISWHYQVDKIQAPVTRTNTLTLLHSKK